MPPAASSARLRIGLPAGVWALGFVSLFMDVSSEMIHALLPVFLVSLGASVAAVGLLEGTAEAIAQVTKVFSGTLSDRLGKRKLLTVVGYGLAALTKPLFALAPSPGWVFAARGLDRVGKGLRGAPRDALIADLTPQETRGAAFGLRQALDTVGAFAGPLLAIALMAATADSFRTVFWIAVIPAAVSVAVLVLFVREPTREQAHRAAERPRVAALVGTLGSRFWWLVLVATLFTLARFSEAFLILKAADVGLRSAYVPAVLVVMNVAYALSAYPAGWLSDRVNRWGVFAVGAALLIAADLVLALGASIAVIGAGVALWGLHMGFTQGLLAALVADTASAAERGTAFGVFNLVTGLALLVASVLAGVLWDRGGPALTFLTGAALTAAAGVVAIALYSLKKIDGRGAAATRG
ncbi:MAG TPA: MFS transporter [Gammaproteobacteria bacterium]|nr:MFS transporter [Gammaproteobacteria bacterium]